MAANRELIEKICKHKNVDPVEIIGTHGEVGVDSLPSWLREEYRMSVMSEMPPDMPVDEPKVPTHKPKTEKSFTSRT